MQRLSLDEANNYLANDPNIAKLKEFATADLQELEPKFMAAAVDGNAFQDEIKLYLHITQKMGLTAHLIPNRIDRKPEALKKHAQFVLAGDYVNQTVSWAKTEELASEYVQALMTFIGANAEPKKLRYSAFTSHALNQDYRLVGMDSLTQHTFNCGLFIFGWKETAPDTGFTYVLGMSAADED